MFTHSRYKITNYELNLRSEDETGFEVCLLDILLLTNYTGKFIGK